jgi:hypothetical protein
MSKVRRALLVSQVIIFFSAIAFATTSVTGNLQDAGGAAVNGRVFVRFWLRGCNANQPRAAGIALIAPAGAPGYYKDFTPDTSGAISGTIYKNSEIECGGQTGVTWWGVQVYRDGKPGPEIPYNVTGSFNLNSATPNTTNPVVPAPTGDSTYCRIDAGNCGFAGSPLPSANNTYDLGTSGAGWRDVWLSRALKPVSNNAVDLGTTALGFRTGYFSTSILPVANNSVDLGSSLSGFRSGYFATSILPVPDNAVDLGSPSVRFRNGFLSGNITGATLTSANNGNSVTLLDNQGTLAGVVGDNTDKMVFASPSLGPFSAGKGFRVKVWTVHSVGTAAITYKLFYGATAVYTTSLTSVDNTHYDYFTIDVTNDTGTQNAQTIGTVDIVNNIAADNPSSGVTTSAANLAVAGVIKWTMNAANTQTVIPKKWIIEAIQ